MQLEHTLSVPAPVDEVWTALLNPEKVAPCMPGATLTGVDGDKFTGTVKVKLGPVALTFKGTGVYVEKDENARRAVIEADAKDTRGNGTVAATITVTLSGDGNRTDGTVKTDMKITGKPAQFGRGMISDVGGKILEQFADCLSKKLGPETASTEAATAQAAESQPNESVPASPPLTAASPGAEQPGGAFVGPGHGAATGENESAVARPNESVPASPSTPTPAPAMTPAPSTPTPAPTPSPAAPPQPEAEPLDLMQYARGSVAARMAPVGVVAILVVVIAVILQRRTGR
ncbi:SRPBCC family protein [Rhodococcus sp. NPDC047139]|uniref:SRPBCC family protein n=1 Tax=Rhodococcus sp. NPDC047139 TaxID=3155141 RepID=UPI0033E44B27